MEVNMQNSKVFNLRIVGIGGQGIVGLSTLIAKVAIKAGLKISVAERPRSAMRLGPITCDLVFSQENLSAFIAPGDADVILSTEPLDGVMNAAFYLKKNGLALLNSNSTATIVETISGEKDKRLDELATEVKNFGGRIEMVNATDVSLEEMGSTFGTNYYLLGVLCAIEKRFPVSAEQIRAVLEKQPDYLRCFERGLAY
jgi:indolepyruvate ferredoxin oxidoreductase beta subunit